jgi:cell division protease FtsH
LTSGFTGADIANLVNEAALAATRRHSEFVESNDFVTAIERIVAGLEKRSRILSKKERSIVAFHEMGHAILAFALPGTDKVQKVSIIPRGIGALGYTIQRPIEDRYLMTQKELMEKISVLLGGRVAERIVFGEVSTGAADDLVKVTNIAEALVTRYGMSPEVGNIVFEQQAQTFLNGLYPGMHQRDRSEESARKIDSEIKKVIEQAEASSQKILESNRAILEQGAALLLEKESLQEEDLRQLMKNLKMPQGQYPGIRSELDGTHSFSEKY